ncbi:hypothetical protein DEHRE_08640 [Dehalobacter restrictus DSM 9455]|jgi:hypothetical protein|uniref:Uncharacterized protein n=1 Tax=Dehalobacter restrictus (strain DSM 9455 / PER-K23) TaxID=871738 RepID=A0ABN4C0F6_DEHRP|nr:hypothetical protein DEHRE_08640 [Dehalobacter restrictus DSM 9455]
MVSLVILSRGFAGYFWTFQDIQRYYIGFAGYEIYYACFL